MKALSFIILLALIIMPVLPVSAEQIGEAVHEIPTPGCCIYGATFDGSTLWVADRSADTLFRIDPKTGGIYEKIPTPGFRPTGLAYDGKHLWVADQSQNRLFRLDPKSQIIDRVLHLSFSAEGGLAWDGESLYVVDGKNDLIYGIDPVDGTIMGKFSAPSKAPTGLTYDGKYLWVADRQEDELYKIDPVRQQVIGILPTLGPHPWGLAWDGKNLWNVDYQVQKIYKINLASENPILTWEPKKLHAAYEIHFFSQGPDPVVSADIAMAVPENCNNQTLLSEVRFTPQPDKIEKDQYGQKIALYQKTDLKAGQVFKARYDVDVQLNKTRFWILPEKVKPLSSIPADIKKQYLTDSRKYQLDNPAVLKAAAEAVGDENNPYWMARNIYQYVMDKLQYDRTGGWDAVPLLLERGSGSCSEYGYVMIALSRAAGIPARYAGSFVTRGEDASVDDVYHRWAEVYLPGYGWVPVDPSRGDKTDLRRQALGFGSLRNTQFITTHNGGGSKYLDWHYNSHVKWTFKGQARAYSEEIGEMSPLE